MSLILKRIAPLGLLGLLLAAGCRSTTSNPADKPSAAPILKDEAMLARTWDPIPAQYANGYSMANPTLFLWSVDTQMPEVVNLFVAPALFYGQVALIPVAALITPPYDEVANHGAIIPSGYTAVPVMHDLNP